MRMASARGPSTAFSTSLTRSAAGAFDSMLSFVLPAASASLSISSMMPRMASWPAASASIISDSDTCWAPASTMTRASRLPATTRSSRPFRRWS